MSSLNAQEEAVEAEWARLQRRLDKIRRLTIDGVMSDAEYQRERDELTDRLARLALPAEVDLDAAGALLERLTSLWEHPATTAEQRKEFCARLFTRVVADTEEGPLTALHLREELSPLFAVLPAQVYTPSGSDGIRTRDLLHDRKEKAPFCGPRRGSPYLAKHCHPLVDGIKRAA
jgi:hypothetical protein